jgi:hypothetical protein
MDAMEIYKIASKIFRFHDKSKNILGLVGRYFRITSSIDIEFGKGQLNITKMSHWFFVEEYEFVSR